MSGSGMYSLYIGRTQNIASIMGVFISTASGSE